MSQDLELGNITMGQAPSPYTLPAEAGTRVQRADTGARNGATIKNGCVCTDAFLNLMKRRVKNSYPLRFSIWVNENTRKKKSIPIPDLRNVGRILARSLDYGSSSIKICGLWEVLVGLLHIQVIIMDYRWHIIRGILSYLVVLIDRGWTPEAQVELFWTEGFDIIPWLSLDPVGSDFLTAQITIINLGKKIPHTFHDLWVD